MTEEDNINEALGFVGEVGLCDFCRKSSKANFIYKVKTFKHIRSGQTTVGICLKCLLSGIIEICKGDKAKIDEYISLVTKDKILDIFKDVLKDRK